MRGLFAGFLFAFAVVAATPARCQDINNSQNFSEAEVMTAIAGALPLLPRINCGNGPCAAPAPEEFSKPPIDLHDARLALRMGTKSAQLNWCGLDWHSRTYEIMMQAFRQKYNGDPRRLALLHMIHSMRQSRDYTNLQVLKTCSAKTRAELDAQNPLIIAAGSMEGLFNDDVVAKMLQIVLDKLPETMCTVKKRCAAVTPEEKATPPVSIDDARAAMRAGQLSGSAQHCGLEWKKRVLAVMITQYRKKKMNDRQLAIMSLLHGLTQGYLAAHYKVRGETCSAEMRNDIDAKLAKPQPAP